MRPKHPVGLGILFFLEMWERYAFYTIQALLVLFLVGQFHFSDPEAYALFGGYSALIYLTPLLGGYLADKWLGFRVAIYSGTLFYIAGLLCLSLFGHKIFYFALSLIVLGNGLIKGNISSLLGTLYQANDLRRDSGFTLFYLGINLGGFLGGALSAYLAVYSWSLTFGVAAAGMTLGLINSLKTFYRLEACGLPPKRLPGQLAFNRLIGRLFFLAIFLAVMISLLLQSPGILGWLYKSIIGLIVALLLAFAFQNKKERNQIIAILLFLVISALFWSIYAQVFSSFVLFVERVVNRTVFGFQLPAAWLVSSQSFFIISLSPCFAGLWLKLEKKRRLYGMYKFSLGLLLLSVAFLSLKIGIDLSSGTVNLGWPLLAMFFCAAGELALSPIGLSIMSELAPERLRGMLMGLWFVSLSVGFGLSTKLAQWAAVPKNLTDLVEIGKIYSHNFGVYAVFALLTGIGAAAIAHWMKHFSK